MTVIEYDGSQLKKPHYIMCDEFNAEYTHPTNIIVGRGSSKVLQDHMCDLEDLKTDDFIYSDDMIHFLIEIPNNTDLMYGVVFQRFFNTRLCEKLNSWAGKDYFKMKGDDILRNTKEKEKYSVSIAAVHNNAIVIHTGINVVAGEEAPSFARNITEVVKDEDISDFFSDFRKQILEEVLDMQIATSKVI